MTDDRFESFLQREARDYNAPPSVPRDVMWARIDAERRARHTGASVDGSRARRWLMAGAAIAAMLLVGIGIGYVWRGTMDSRLVAEHVGDTTSTTTRQRAGISSEVPDAEQSRGARSPERRVAALPPLPRSGGKATNAAPPARQESAAYAAITAEHLGRVEALLTSFNAESESGRVDPEISSWAGDLLGTTRLLLDSPGASDPRLHRLLGDLEIVLTQITQLHARQGSAKDELQLIDQSLRSHDMMTRIRGATPAGAGALPIGT